MNTASPFFYDAETLLERLSTGLQKHPQEVVLLLGSPLSAPTSPNLPGVPDVEGLINLIRAEFADDANQESAFQLALTATQERRYQSAFVFLLGRRGPQTRAKRSDWQSRPPGCREH